MSYQLIPKSEIINRIEVLQMKLQKEDIDGVFLTKNVDIFYYSGSMQNSFLFVPAVGEPILFVKKSVERALEETPLTVEPFKSIKTIPQQLAEKRFTIASLGMELDVLPVNNYLRLQKVFEGCKLIDVSHIIRMQRSVKSEYELKLLDESAKIVNDAILEIPNIIYPGITELELTTELEKFVRLRGHLGYVRTRAYNMELVLGMVASGGSAAMRTSFDGPAGGEGLAPAMPQGSGWNKIKPNEPILIDIAAAKNGYIIDQTRMAVIGELDEELEHAYQVSIEIKQMVEEKAKPGTLWSEHYLNALAIVQERGLSDHFMGYKEDQAKFLGHGVGLELDEFPILAKGLDMPLENGMVIAIEPKFTYPDKGVIGIENTYVVTDRGLKRISIAPEEIIRIPV